MIKNIAKRLKFGECFGENMEKTKNIDKIVTIFSISIISLALISLLCDRFISFSIEKSSKKIITEYPENYPFKFEQGRKVYNFDKMLVLIEQFRVLEYNFYSNYEDFVKDPNNLKRIESMLRYLKNEKSEYKNYLKKIKLYHSTSHSTKRRDSLIYYRRVLEGAVRELKDMSKKINLKQGL